MACCALSHRAFEIIGAARGSWVSHAFDSLVIPLRYRLAELSQDLLLAEKPDVLQKDLHRLLDKF